VKNLKFYPQRKGKRLALDGKDEGQETDALKGLNETKKQRREREYLVLVRKGGRKKLLP